MKLHVVIDNVYDDGTITNEYDLDVEEPDLLVDKLDDVTEQLDDEEDWAYRELFPWTGSGRESGEAGYFLEITSCDDRPDLVGRKFEWGI